MTICFEIVDTYRMTFSKIYVRAHEQQTEYFSHLTDFNLRQSSVRQSLFNRNYIKIQ